MNKQSILYMFKENSGTVKYMPNDIEYAYEIDGEFVIVSWEDNQIEGYKGGLMKYTHKQFQNYLDTGLWGVV